MDTYVNWVSAVFTLLILSVVAFMLYDLWLSIKERNDSVTRGLYQTAITDCIEEWATLPYQPEVPEEDRITLDLNWELANLLYEYRALR